MSRCFGIIAVSKVSDEEEGKERLWEGFREGWGQGGDLYILFHWWDWVPLDAERSLVLSFPEPCLCRTVPLLLPPPPPPPSIVHSFSPWSRSDPLSERREFWRDGVLGWRESWPFFSSEVNLGKKKEWNQAEAHQSAVRAFYPPASACTEGWSWVLRSCACMVSTTLLNLRLGPNRDKKQQKKCIWIWVDTRHFYLSYISNTH